MLLRSTSESSAFRIYSELAIIMRFDFLANYAFLVIKSKLTALLSPRGRFGELPVRWVLRHTRDDDDGAALVADDLDGGKCLVFRRTGSAWNGTGRSAFALVPESERLRRGLLDNLDESASVAARRRRRLLLAEIATVRTVKHVCGLFEDGIGLNHLNCKRNWSGLRSENGQKDEYLLTSLILIVSSRIPGAFSSILGSGMSQYRKTCFIIGDLAE